MFIKDIVEVVAWSASWSVLSFPGMPVSRYPYKMNLFSFFGGSVCFFLNELCDIGWILHIIDGIRTTE